MTLVVLVKTVVGETGGEVKGLQLSILTSFSSLNADKLPLNNNNNNTPNNSKYYNKGYKNCMETEGVDIFILHTGAEDNIFLSK